MSDEKKDLNKEQPVTDSDLTAPVVEEPGVETVLADGTSQDKDVPYSKFKEANDAKKEALAAFETSESARLLAEQQAQQSRDQLAVLQANQAHTQQRVSNYEQALNDCNLAGEDYLTQAQTIQLNARKEQLDFQAIQQQGVVAANQQFVAAHPDYCKAVGTTNPYSQQFLPSAELQQILTENPHLQASCGTAQGAYTIVMEQRKLTQLTKDAAAMSEHQGQEQIDANLAPMSAQAAGGGGTREKALINAGSSYSDVADLERRVKDGEFG